MTRLKRIAQLLDQYPELGAKLNFNTVDYVLRGQCILPLILTTKEELACALKNNRIMYLGIEGITSRPPDSYVYVSEGLPISITWWQI